MSLSPTLAFQFNFCVHLDRVHFLADFSERFSISSLFFRQFQFPFVSRFWGKCDGSRNLLVIPLFTVYQQLCLLLTVTSLFVCCCGLLFVWEQLLLFWFRIKFNFEQMTTLARPPVLIPQIIHRRPLLSCSGQPPCQLPRCCSSCSVITSLSSRQGMSNNQTTWYIMKRQVSAAHWVLSLCQLLELQLQPLLSDNIALA